MQTESNAADPKSFRNNPAAALVKEDSNQSLYKEAARNASVDEKSTVYKNEEWNKLINTNSADTTLCWHLEMIVNWLFDIKFQIHWNTILIF